MGENEGGCDDELEDKDEDNDKVKEDHIKRYEDKVAKLRVHPSVEDDLEEQKEEDKDEHKAGQWS